MAERTGGAGPAGVCPGSGLQQESWGCGRRCCGPIPAAGEMDAVDTVAGPRASPCSARTTADCCRRWRCWRPTSPGGGRTPAPHSSSSCWRGGPCLCCYTEKWHKAVKLLKRSSTIKPTDNCSSGPPMCPKNTRPGLLPDYDSVSAHGHAHHSPAGPLT